jgi:hypothetical protein
LDFSGSLRPHASQTLTSSEHMRQQASSQGINPNSTGLKHRVSTRLDSTRSSNSGRHNHRPTGINQQERAKHAWAELYGRSNAAPRISVMPTSSGKSRVLWRDVRQLVANNEIREAMSPDGLDSVDEGLDEAEEETSPHVTEDSSSKKANNEEGSAPERSSGEEP